MSKDKQGDDDTVKWEALLEKFSADQKNAAFLAIEVMKTSVTRQLIKELRIYMLIAVGALTGFGLFSWSGLREDIATASSKALTSNPDLEKEVRDAMRIRLERIQNAEGQIDKEVASLSRTLADEFARLEQMLSQIEADINDHQRLRAHADEPKQDD